jgi:hypothetical protein
MGKYVLILFFLLYKSCLSQTSQKFEFSAGLNTSYTRFGVTDKFFPGFQLGIQTVIQTKRKNTRFFCVGVDYNYFGIITKINTEPNTNPSTIKGLNVLSIIVGPRYSFRNLTDNYFQWGFALNFSYKEATVGSGPKFSFGFKVMDKEKHKLFLSPQFGINLFLISASSALPFYSYGCLRLNYQISYK